MKRRIVGLLAALMLIFTSVQAQTSLGTAPNGTFSANDIEYWIGEGDSKIGIIVMYDDDKLEHQNIAFGYRWSGSAKTLTQIFEDINSSDEKFNIDFTSSYGGYVNNFYLDLDEDQTFEYEFSDDCSWMSIYSSMTSVWDFSKSFSGGEWVSIECGYSSNAGSAEYWALSVSDDGCKSVKDLAVSSITTNSAVISFTDALETNDYVLYWKSESDNDFTSQALTQTSYTLTNLESNTLYSYYIQNNCNNGLTKESSQKTFRTKCLTMASSQLPYTETFDTYVDALPYCWDFVYTASGTNYPQTTIANPHSSPRCLKISSQNTSAYSVCQGLDDDIDMTDLKISLWARSIATTAADTTFKIGLVSNADAEDFEELATITPTTSWKQYEIFLSNKTFDATKRYIAIKSENNGYRSMFIDDFTISEVSNCEHPWITDVEISAGEDNATVKITIASAKENDNDFYVCYKKAGGEADSIEVNDKTATLELDLAANYDIWVRTICAGGEVSDVFEVKTIKTPCASISIPYVENFNSYGNNQVVDCWTKSTSGTVQTATYQPYEGNACLSITGGYSGSKTYFALPYLKDSADITNVRLSFYGKGYGAERNIEVGIMTDATDVSTFYTVKELTLVKDQWTKYDVDFSEYTYQGRYVAIMYKSTGSYQTSYYDSIVLSYVPSCDKPADIILTADNEDAKAVNVAFTAPEGSDTWNLYYKTAEEDDYSSIMIYENPYKLENLTLKSDYTIYMTTVCGNKESEVSNTVTYQTLCYAEAIDEFPYTVDFENNSLRCLNQITLGTNEITWKETETTNGYFTGYNSSAEGEKFLILSGNGAHAMLVLPKLNLTSLTNPVVSFYNIQKKYGVSLDTLTVLYRTDEAQEWVTLKKFADEIADWTLQYIELPNPSTQYQIAFEGTYKGGRGVAIDSISVSDYVCNPIVVEIEDSLCQGSTYTLYDNEYTDTGIYTIQRTGIFNCDTTINLTLTYKQPYDSVMIVKLCEGSVLSVNGEDYADEGEFEITVSSNESCDTNIHLSIIKVYPSDTTIDLTLSEGDKVVIADEEFSEQGNFVRTIINADGCDSTITINIIVNSSLDPQKANSINKDDSSIVAWAIGVEVERDANVTDGNYYDAVGKTQNTEYVSLANGGKATVTFDRLIQNEYGFDFVVFSHGNMINTAFVEVSSDGENYFRFPAASMATDNETAYTGDMYTNLAGVYNTGYGIAFDLDDLEDNADLDKYAVRYVRVIGVKSGVDTDSASNIIYDAATTGFLFAGIGVINGGEPYQVADMSGLLTTSESYEIVNASTNGAYLDNSNYVKDYVSAGMNFQGIGYDTYGWIMSISWGPSNLTKLASNGYYISSAQAGMDGKGDTYLQAFYSNFAGTIEHCSAKKEDGSEFWPQGVYVSHTNSSFTYTGTTNDGQAGYHKIVATGYDENGQQVGTTSVNITENGTPFKDWRWLDLSSLGEVSKVVFSLESNYANSWGLLIPAYFCIDNFVYTNSDPHSAITGKTTIKATICANSSYTFAGKELTQSGTYTDTLTTTDGADSIVVLKLTVEELNSVTLNAEVCYGEVFTFNGKTYTSSQTIIDTVSATEGCDTVYTVNLTILDKITADTSVTISPEELPYQFGGQTFNGAGDYELVLKAENGCDSTLTLHLNVQQGLNDAGNTAEITLYPNPAKDVIFIENVVCSTEHITINIYDINGKLVLSETKQNATSYILNTTLLQSGVYYMRITADNINKTLKFIKE